MRIGIDMGATNIRIGVVDEGEIIKKISKLTLANRSQDEIVNDLIASIKEVFTSDIKSIGIGVPSVVDFQRGIVYNVANIPSWKEVHLKDILQKEFDIPVFVDNDCNCIALGEYHYGVGRGSHDMVCMAVGTGVGAGLIFNGQLYRGRNTGAGEIGSLPYLDMDFESYCSGQFFVQRNIDGKVTAQNAAEGDVDALGLFNELGHHVGHLMNAVLFAYDPEVIVLGGSVINSFPYFSKSMYKVMGKFPYPETVNNLEIRISNTQDVGIYGASCLSF